MPDSMYSVTERGKPGAIARLPRRPAMLASGLDGPAPAQMRFLTFKFSRLRAAARLFTWFLLLAHFYFAAGFDRLRRRDSVARRARRLRQDFEKRGGSFAKLGVHLSMRVDLIPWEYSVELSRMQDRINPFPVETAVQIIERTTGRPLASIFARFDPHPIASNSLACIYQATFHNGDEAIVKVRRPHVGEQFMADLQAFDWLLLLAELLTIFRPGFTQDIRAEFRAFLLEELDFVEAARRQDAFRRAAAKSGQGFFSAPRVYLGLSCEEVVVEEFASGMWLWELIAAVDQGNEAVLEQARQLNIVPATVGKRLLWVNNWSREENLFFHADPHPNNIILGRDSRLYFINFAVTASLSRSQRNAVQQSMDYLRQRDALNVARSCLNLMEPMPPIDVAQLVQELESYTGQLIFALEAAPASLTWQERTSAAQWIGMVRLARKYRIVLDTRVLRLMRATLLVESAAVRLHHPIDFEKQYRKFHRYRAAQARQRIVDAVERHLEGNVDEKLIIRIDRIGQILSGLFFRTRRLLALPSVNLSALMSKGSFTLYILMRFAFQAIAVTGVAALLDAAGWLLFNGTAPPAFSRVLQSVITSPIYIVVLLFLILVNGRMALFRLDDIDA